MRSTRPTLSLLAGLTILATACTANAPGKSPAEPSPVSPATGTVNPAPRTSPGPSAAIAPTLPPGSPDAWLAVGRTGQPGLEVILASTRERMLDLPSGVPIRSDWGRMIATKQDGPKTVVNELVVQPGFGGPSVAVDGAWRLPTIGPDPVPVGVSADGQTIVLVEAAKPASSDRTRFAVLRRGVLEPAKMIDLAGRFDYDALSPDGTVLYVVEHLDPKAGGRYQVRAVDLAAGKLRDGAIVDKRNIDEEMAGYPLAQVRRADGGVLTLYRGTEHPFLHALNSVDGWALCIDLPSTKADDTAAAADWGLAEAPNRQTYAINATLGLVVELDPTGFEISRSTAVTPLAASGIVLAKFGHQESGPTGRRVVVSPDGRTVYAAGAGGILAIDVASLKIRDTLEAGKAIEALAVTPDGGTLYALVRDGGRIVKIDAVRGKELSTVPGDGYDRLVAVVPW